MRGFLTVERGRKDGALWWSVRGELVANADGSQLYVARLGGKYIRLDREDLVQEDKAIRAYRAFRKRSPDKRVRAVRIDPEGESTVLGDILHVVYIAPNGRSYVHKFGAPRPRLWEFENGQLWITGGNYTVGSAGIIG